MTVEADGFIAREPNHPRVLLRQSPVAFLKVLLTKIRREPETVRGLTKLSGEIPGPVSFVIHLINLF
jgi:hypothetical protein